MDKKKLVVCAIFANAAAALPEWLAYHSVVGVGHFVLYDNGSTDDPARLIRNLPLAEHVTLIRWPQQSGQMAAYRHFIDIFAPGFEWAAFLGVDEFLLPLTGRSVLPTLEFLDVASAVLVHRRVFSPGTGQDSPAGLRIERYNLRSGDDFPANRHVRVIARCSDLLDVTQDPNAFRVSGQVVNTAGHLAPNTAIQPLPCYQNLVVNHYRTGPREAWLAAVRADCAAAGTETLTPDDILVQLSRHADDAIQAFAPAVREVLGLAPWSTAVATGHAVERTAPAPAPPSPAAPVAGSAAVPHRAEATPPAAAADMTAVAEPVPGPTSAASDRQEARPPPAATTAIQTRPVWVSRGEDAQERVGGLALVFRDRSHFGEHWLAALRGAAAAGIDPAFLMDEFDRIQDFPTAEQACAACDLVLAQEP